jgi:excisionase family DNA binding protein
MTISAQVPGFRRLPKGDVTEFQDLPHKTLLRPEEVALFMSVSLKTIYRWFRSGVIDGAKIQGSLRIYRESVIRLMEKDGSFRE